MDMSADFRPYTIGRNIRKILVVIIYLIRSQQWPGFCANFTIVSTVGTQESMSCELSVLVMVHPLILVALTRTRMVWEWVSVESSSAPFPSSGNILQLRLIWIWTGVMSFLAVFTCMKTGISINQTFIYESVMNLSFINFYWRIL